MANRTDRAVRRHSYTFCHRPPGVLRLPLSMVFTSAFCFDFGTVFLCLPYYYTPKSRFCQFVLSQNFESRKKIKIDKIREKLDSNECELAILIDDTHDILFLALSELKEKVIPFHVITLID